VLLLLVRALQPTLQDFAKFQRGARGNVGLCAFNAIGVPPLESERDVAALVACRVWAALGALAGRLWGAWGVGEGQDFMGRHGCSKYAPRR